MPSIQPCGAEVSGSRPVPPDGMDDGVGSGVGWPVPDGAGDGLGSGVGPLPDGTGDGLGSGVGWPIVTSSAAPSLIGVESIAAALIVTSAASRCKPGDANETTSPTLALAPTAIGPRSHVRMSALCRQLPWLWLVETSVARGRQGDLGCDRARVKRPAIGDRDEIRIWLTDEPGRGSRQLDGKVCARHAEGDRPIRRSGQCHRQTASGSLRSRRPGMSFHQWRRRQAGPWGWHRGRGPRPGSSPSPRPVRPPDRRLRWSRCDSRSPPAPSRWR